MSSLAETTLAYARDAAGERPRPHLTNALPYHRTNFHLDERTAVHRRPGVGAGDGSLARIEEYRRVVVFSNDFPSVEQGSRVNDVNGRLVLVSFHGRSRIILRNARTSAMHVPQLRRAEKIEPNQAVFSSTDRGPIWTVAAG